MEHKLISRDEAKAAGLKRYFTGDPCKRGHVAERLTSSGTCCECKRLRERSAERRAYMAVYREEHAEKTKAYMAEYKKSDKYKAYEQSERYREARRRTALNGAAAHPHRAVTATIRARHPAAIVPLTEAEQSRLRWFYATARELSKRTGREYHVDHSFPLQLGGIHHPLNLMILPAWVNQRKYNKYQPDNPLAVRGLHLAARLSLRIQQPTT